MIKVKMSPTADSRTCNYEEVTIQQLLNSSLQHINDVANGMEFFVKMLRDSAKKHDYDKITSIDDFYKSFKSGFKDVEWYEEHKKLNRHHLFVEEGIPSDVNLIDVIELICDCVMAGMSRSGKVYDLNLDAYVLEKAFKNTVELLKKNVKLEED